MLCCIFAILSKDYLRWHHVSDFLVDPLNQLISGSHPGKIKPQENAEGSQIKATLSTWSGLLVILLLVWVFCWWSSWLFFNNCCYFQSTMAKGSKSSIFCSCSWMLLNKNNTPYLVKEMFPVHSFAVPPPSRNVRFFSLLFKYISQVLRWKNEQSKLVYLPVYWSLYFPLMSR